MFSSTPRFPDEPAPRWAILAPDERVSLLAHRDRDALPVAGEVATGATLVVGEVVIIADRDQAWTGVVRRVSVARGAMVQELTTA